MCSQPPLSGQSGCSKRGCCWINTGQWYYKQCGDHPVCNVRDSFDHSIILWRYHNLSLHINHISTIIIHLPPHSLPLRTKSSMSLQYCTTGPSMHHGGQPAYTQREWSPSTHFPTRDHTLYRHTVGLVLPFETCWHFVVCMASHKRSTLGSDLLSLRMPVCLLVCWEVLQHSYCVNMGSSSVPRVYCTPGGRQSWTVDSRQAATAITSFWVKNTPSQCEALATNTSLHCTCHSPPFGWRSTKAAPAIKRPAAS